MYSKISQLFAKFTRFNKFFGIFLNSKNHLNSFKSSSKSFEIQKFVQNSLFRKLTLSLLIPASSLTMRRVIFSLLLIHSRKPVSFSNNWNIFWTSAGFAALFMFAFSNGSSDVADTTGARSEDQWHHVLTDSQRRRNLVQFLLLDSPLNRSVIRNTLRCPKKLLQIYKK